MRDQPRKAANDFDVRIDVSRPQEMITVRVSHDNFELDVLVEYGDNDKELPILEQHIDQVKEKRDGYVWSFEQREAARVRIARGIAHPQWKATYSIAASTALKAAW